MSAVHGAASDVQRRAHELVDAESFRPHRRADNVHHGVHRPHFMKVNFFDRYVMNFGFGGTKLFEDRDSSCFGLIADLGVLDDFANFGEAAAMRMLVSMGITVMAFAVMMFVSVGMLVWRGRPRPRLPRPLILQP